MARPSPADADADAADLAACRAALADGSRTFLAASHLLPRRVRDPACALYAFCRMADDAVDRHDGGLHAVQRLRERLDAVYRDAPCANPPDRALSRVVRRFDLPRALPESLLEGFAWDAEGRRYDTIEDLYDYAARVAGSVGAMMAVLMGARGAPALARACDLGVAMQLSNIARDVGEDARMGRLYLPRRWMHEAGLDADAWLARPVFSPALGAVVQRVLDAAEVLYRRVGAGVAELPLDCRPGINAARFLYAQIGHQVARQGLDSVGRRAVVAPGRKALVLLASMAATFPPTSEPLPPLPATRHLVDAAAMPQPRTVAAPHWWNLGRRLAAVVELFDRLERRDGAPLRPHSH